MGPNTVSTPFFGRFVFKDNGVFNFDEAPPLEPFPEAPKIPKAPKSNIKTKLKRDTFFPAYDLLSNERQEYVKKHGKDGLAAFEHNRLYVAYRAEKDFGLPSTYMRETLYEQALQYGRTTECIAFFKFNQDIEDCLPPFAHMLRNLAESSFTTFIINRIPRDDDGESYCAGPLHHDPETQLNLKDVFFRELVVYHNVIKKAELDGSLGILTDLESFMQHEEKFRFESGKVVKTWDAFPLHMVNENIEMNDLDINLECTDEYLL